jgi:N-acetylmuramoyl-L-alanine amidase
MLWNKAAAGMAAVALLCLVAASGAAPEQLTTFNAQTTAAEGPEPAQDSALSPPESHPRAPEFVVIIDPGHGGSDKGASLGGKLLEKEVTLRMARELRKELEERGIAARLLRDADIDMPLAQRAEITNGQHAAIYVSIHAARAGRGVRVYFPLLTAPHEQPVAVRFVPWESAQSGSLTRSQTAAQAVASELRKKGVTVTSLSIPLRPLNNIVIPAIAIELAPEADDAQSLESQKRQNAVATSIALGIAQFRAQLGVRP